MALNGRADAASGPFPQPVDVATLGAPEEQVSVPEVRPSGARMLVSD